jgi:serine/threonine protein kinase
VPQAPTAAFIPFIAIYTSHSIATTTTAAAATKVDYWGLGVLIYEMVVGRAPFVDPYNGDKTVICRNIVNGKLTFPFYMGVDGKTPLQKASVDLIRQLLSRDPEQRLGRGNSGSTALTMNAWFKSVDFSKVHHGDLKVNSSRSITWSLFWAENVSSRHHF